MDAILRAYLFLSEMMVEVVEGNFKSFIAEIYEKRHVLSCKMNL